MPEPVSSSKWDKKKSNESAYKSQAAPEKVNK